MIKGVFTRSLKTIEDGFSRLTEAFDNTFNSDESKKNLESWVDETNKIYDNAVENFKKKEKIEFISVKDIDKAVNTASHLVDKVLNKIKTKLGLNGGGGTSDNSPTVQTPSEQLGIQSDELNLNMESPSWMYEFGDGLDLVNEKIAETKSLMDVLSETFGINKVLLTEYGIQLGKTFMEGADSMAEFATNVKNSIREAISAVLALAVANAVQKAMEGMPAFPGSIFLIPAIAGLAGGLAKTAFNSLIPKFAEGGLVTGPTMGLIGEGSGTSMSNPEVIAPLDQLKKYMNNGVNQKLEVFGRITGNDIFISNQRGFKNRLRTV